MTNIKSENESNKTEGQIIKDKILEVIYDEDIKFVTPRFDLFNTNYGCKITNKQLTIKSFTTTWKSSINKNVFDNKSSNKSLYYWSYKIDECLPSNCIQIGLVKQGYISNKSPLMSSDAMNSYSFYLNNNTTYSSAGNTVIPFLMERGDRIGLLYDICNGSLVLFKNEEFLSKCFHDMESELYPCVAIHDNITQISIINFDD